MATELDDFITKAKSKGLNDKQIRAKLKTSGWDESDIDEALDDLVAPPPPTKAVEPSPQSAFSQSDDSKPQEPIAVVQNLSVHGFEYAIMFISLLISAFAIGTLAHKFVFDMFDRAAETYSYGGTDSVSAFMITVLIVCFPIFAYLFLRLKKAEIANPALRNDPSRRKWSQFTQLVTFLVGVGYLIGFLFTIINPSDGLSDSTEPVKVFLNMFITLVIAGGIFIYFWREDHHKAQ